MRNLVSDLQFFYAASKYIDKYVEGNSVSTFLHWLILILKVNIFVFIDLIVVSDD